MRIFREIFEICESRYCAWTWRASAIYLCMSRELFVGKSVWRFLFEEDELGDFCKVFDVKCACSPSDYGD